MRSRLAPFTLWLLLCLPAGPAAAQLPDCLGPAPEAEPGTPAWFARDAGNIACAERRLVDSSGNRIEDRSSSTPLRDGYRDPEPHTGKRFRFDTATVSNRAGSALPTEIYRPCTADSCTEVPPGVTVTRGPYPTIVVVHGGASGKELHRWATQSLAEAGYMAIAFDVAENSGGDHATDAQDIIDWLFSADFPFADELRRDRVGIAGHSQGASTASLLGQIDDRLKVIVAWDNLTSLKTEWDDDIGVEPPADVVISKPALGIGADYYFVPTPNPIAPEPFIYNGEGGRGRGFTPHPKDYGYQELKAAQVDTMLFMLRAGTHLDFTPTTRAPASAYGEAVSVYLTLAWFDRYLRGLDDPALARQAYHRLVGTTRFDDSADLHSIGAGIYDPATGNQPYKLAETSLCDRLSFYYKSRYALRAPGSNTLLNSEDLRADCYAGKVAPAAGPAGGGGDPAGPGQIGGGGAFAAFGLLLALALRQRRAVRR